MSNSESGTTNYSKLDATLHILGAHLSISPTTVCPVIMVRPQYTGCVDFPMFAPTWLSWIKSYLTQRRQRVLANNMYSSFKTIMQGVPQGSVLGPLFYIMYANDVVKSFKNCSVAQYADDTVLYVADSAFPKAVEKMQGIQVTKGTLPGSAVPL